MSDNYPALVLGGGCFWCLEAAYKRLDGVVSVQSGYAGGHMAQPDYRTVCSGTTGHAEVVKVVYDPAKVTAEQLLGFFWEVHNPTTLNRQGADVGTQYRSIILYDGPEQESQARASLEALKASGKFYNPPVTEIVPLEDFWPAEEYHDDYFDQNPNERYCRLIIQPKLEKLGLLTK